MRWWVLGAALLAQGAAAETRQHGNIIYTLPADVWTGTVEDGVQTLGYSPDDEVCRFCYLYLGRGGPKDGSLGDFAVDAARRMLDEDDRDGAELVQEPQPMQASGVPAVMTALRSGDDILLVFGLELADRYEAVGFLTDGGYDGADLAANLERMQAVAVPMFDGLRFVSEGAAPLMPDAVPGPMSGVWLGMYFRQTFGIDMMLRMETDFRYLVFWDNGYFYDGTPPGGTGPMDLSLLQTAGDTAYGTYRVDGNSLILSYVTGETETLARSDQDGLNDGNRDLYPAELLQTGTKINGRISSFFYSGFTPGAGIEGGVSSSSETVFRPDGSYTGSSFGGAFGNFVDGAGSSTGGFATSNGADDGGRYEVIDGMLIQYPADGSEPLMSFLVKFGGDVLIGTQFLEPN